MGSVGLEHYFQSLGTDTSKIFGDVKNTTPIIVLDIIDLVNGQTEARKRRLENAGDATQYLLHQDAPRTRLVSVCSVSSLKPLGLPSLLLNQCMLSWDIHPEILDVISSFGRKPKNCDAGAGAMTIKRSSSGKIHTQYLFTYPEAVRSTSTPWTLRQIGVYHQYCPQLEQDDQSSWILFHAKNDSTIQKRIEDGFKTHDCILKTHLIVLSAHMKSWRWYLDSLNIEFEGIVAISVTLDFERPDAYQTGSDLLQRLQHFEDTILPLVPRLKSIQATFEKMVMLAKYMPQESLSSNREYDMYLDEAESFSCQVKGYIESTDLLTKRSHRTLDILSAGLSLQNQNKGLGVSHVMLNLTKDAVEDSATVRVVTIVTLIYLPASFVSSLLGTNLFTFQTSEGSGFQVSRQFWIFVVTSVPLTMLTVGSWLFYVRKRASLSERKVRRVSSQEVENTQ